jgi:putative (di)nucleoside polyphosphate hydrolase
MAMNDIDFNSLPYRPCVGIALFNHENKVFVGERIDTVGAWQMPQGGIDPGESIEDALYREIMEEIGTDKAEILKIHDEPTRYDLPPRLREKLWVGKYRGQEQIWVAARFTGKDTDIDLEAFHEPEFRDWKWIHLEEILDFAVPFKRDTYRKVIEAFICFTD